MDFYDWLIENYDKCINDYDLLEKIYCMFDLNSQTKDYDKIELFKKIKIVNGPIMMEEIKQIFKLDGFIFPMKNGL